MTPVSNNSSLGDFFPSTNSIDILNNAWITAVFCNKLKELKNYTSEFEFINRAIQEIPASENLHSSNVEEVMRKFNDVLATYNKFVDPLPIISCVQEVEELEEQLNEHSRFLGALWAALPINNKPLFETVTQIIAWFENPQNQFVLDTITFLNLENCKFTQIAKEFFKLRNLEVLEINVASEKSILPIIERFENLKKFRIIKEFTRLR